MLRRRILKLTPEALWVFTEQAGVAVAAPVLLATMISTLDVSCLQNEDHSGSYSKAQIEMSCQRH